MSLLSRILFVDDDRSTREGYAAYLAGHGFDVRAVATGREAFDVAVQWAPAVIVLDLGLPDIDGWELARRIKATPHLANASIIALTGADLVHERVSDMRAGCDRYLTKPFTKEGLVEAVVQHLRAPSVPS